MRKMVERIAAAAVATALVWSGISMYKGYIEEEIYKEGVQNIESTYGQMGQTFQLFIQRNWNVLSAYQTLLTYAHSAADVATWQDFLSKQQAWQYSDFYLFNEENEYITERGRKGQTDSIEGVFREMYRKKQPVVSSYIATSGDRKIVFAVPLEYPQVVDGITYTGMALSYDNKVVENLISGNIYNGHSDSYVVDSTGRVILSLAPKSEILDRVTNMPDFISGNGHSVIKGSVEDMRKGLETGGRGGLLFERNGNTRYVTYESLGIADWSIVGVVHAEDVNGSLLHIRRLTTNLLLLLSGLLAFVTIVFILRESQRRFQKERAEKAALENKADILTDLYVSMQKVVDRIAIGNFKTGKYVYREQLLSTDLYPREGKYEDLVRGISQRYVAVGDTAHMKISHILSEAHLRKALTDKDSVFKFEYMGRKKETYKLMTVVPASWDDEGNLERVLLIGQDIGEKHALENMANTDGLTGLFNERYFNMVLSAKENRNQPFMLFYLDLDKFKPINDTYGHTAGDKVLQETAKRLQKCIRESDYAFRIGGDEFTLVISSDHNEALQKKLEERLVKIISEPFQVDGHTLEVGVSLGAASFPKEAKDAARVRILADERMYECKERNHHQR